MTKKRIEKPYVDIVFNIVVIFNINNKICNIYLNKFNKKLNYKLVIYLIISLSYYKVKETILCFNIFKQIYH